MTKKLKTVNFGHKYRIYPTKEQKEVLDHHGFIYNQAYNICLNIWKKEQKSNKDKPKKEMKFRTKGQYDKLVKRILNSRKLSFKTVVAQQARINFFKAVDNAFTTTKKKERAKAIANAVTPKEKAKAFNLGLPVHKDSSRIRRSFTWTNQAVSLKPHKRKNYRYLKISGELIKLRYHRDLPEDHKLCSVVVSRDAAGDYYASLNIETRVFADQLTGDKETLLKSSIGLDMNVNNFTYSSLEFSEMVNNESKKSRDKKKSKKFKLIERKQSRRILVAIGRKTKPSKNHSKSQKKMNKIHKKLKNSQNDLYHKLSRQLVNNFEMIAIEDLNTKNMSKSSKGNSVKPGKKVKQKSGLNRSILSASFHEFSRMLEYKQTLFNDKLLIKVDPKHTSQSCSRCMSNGIEFRDKDNRKSQSKFKCLQCGFTANADINASINILFRALNNYGFVLDDFDKLIGTGNVLALEKKQSPSLENISSL